MSEREDDIRWMAQALALAALADGGVSPNPRVGCVVVRDGAAVGAGYHLAPGQPHAEVLALTEAGDLARGATLYVNLEPCAHHGRTPPCTDLVIASGVRRVVAAMQDPDPRVNGQGFELLREHGIETTVGLAEEQAVRLNAPFVHWHTHGTPRVTLKAGLSLDGQLAAAGGVSRWITSAPSRRFAHRLRWRHDAILVGAGTVRRDDPRLTVRLPGLEADRLRIVLSRDLDLDPASKLFSSEVTGNRRVRVYTTAEARDRDMAKWEAKAELVATPLLPAAASSTGGLDLGWILRHLGAEGVQSVLVEGGGQTHAAFLQAGLADDAALFVASTLLAARGATPFLDADAVAEPALGWRLQRRETLPLGDDLLVMGTFVDTAATRPRHDHETVRTGQG